ncbi:MAG: NADH-quinone oxidoreductase subunit C [Caldisphaera sp.]|jgi:NADH-quinone oxidoreductase subunit C|nr:MAG: NADH-quinone oxidoreductase subunit C [Caldisphaera sp.]
MIKNILKDNIVSIEENKGYIDIIVPVEKLVESAKKLKEAGFDHVKSVTAVDYIAKKQFKVTYHISSFLNEDLSKYILGLSSIISRDNPHIPSLSRIWVSAEFQEREVYEFFGIVFDNHPDLRLLLLTPVVAALKPLRKDFVVKEESDNIETDYAGYNANKWW